MCKIITTKSKKLIKEFYDKSALTLEGITFDSIPDYIDDLKENCGLKDGSKVYVIKGSTLNKLTNSEYPNDCNIVVIKLANFNNLPYLCCYRFRFGGRWFDDVIQNYGNFNDKEYFGV